MKKIHGFLKKNYIFILLSLLFFVIRLPYLDQLNLLHDERDIALSGYAIAKTGRDLYGNLLPLNFQGISPDNPLVSIYYSALWWIFIPVKSVFTARLPYVFISTFLFFIVYELTRTLTKNRSLSLLTAVIFCFNPWVFHITRLAMDVSLAIVTLLGGVLLFIKSRRVPAYILFILSFYNYQGFRILMPFLVAYLEYFQWLTKSDNVKKHLLMSAAFLVLLYSSVLVVDRNVTFKRANQVLFLNTDTFTNQVVDKRNTSAAPQRLKILFHNKLTESVAYAASVFVKGQSSEFLFISGDNSPTNGNVSSGQFLFPFIFFFYAGLISLGITNKKEYYFTASLAILGLLPAMASLNGISFGIRGSFSCFGYSFILAAGCFFVIEKMKKWKALPRIVFFLVIAALFAISIVYFSYNYYFRRPILAGEMFNQHELQIARVILNDNLVLYHSNPKEVFLTMALLDNRHPITDYRLRENSTTYSVRKSTIYACPSQNTKPAGHYAIYEGCLTDSQYQTYEGNSKIKRIDYTDISKRTAYFIFE